MPASELQLRLEGEAKAACELDDHGRAATLLIEAYGAELLRFLAARLGDPDAACDVYSEVVERLWRSLPRFEWRHGARGYCYAIARNTAINYASRKSRRPSRNVPLSDVSEALKVADRVRTATLPFLRTEVKDRFRELREQLSSDDQMLMSLRLDRALEWRELALAMTFSDQTPTDQELAREAARLRQRFKSAKDKLRRFAEREGLIE